MGTWSQTLDALVRERGGALYGYAFVLAGERGAADRLLRHALAKAFRKAPGNMPIGAAEAYVRRAMQSATYAASELHHHRPEAADPADLHGAVLALPPRQRACAVMHYLDGLSSAQIAHELNIDPDAARDHLAAAAELLGQEHPEIDFSAADLSGDEQVTIVVNTTRGKP